MSWMEMCVREGREAVRVLVRCVAVIAWGSEGCGLDIFWLW
jgi:hypothetical protein